MIDKIKVKELANMAREMRNNSYVPYSGFAVGAALLCRNGKIYGGCNIENAAYGPSICAERTAIAKAVSEDQRDFIAIAIAGGKKGEKVQGAVPPCGVCRQVMREFCDPKNFEVILVTSEEEFESHTLGEMLPMSFGPENL